MVDSFRSQRSAANEKFVYAPLGENGVIRMLELLPSECRTGAISCNLKDMPLATAEDEYEALSYAWGDEAPTESIHCNGKTVTVRPNLYQALQRLRHRRKSRFLWIDALCINQDDIRERNRQVSLMKDIFGNARQVNVWLGEEADDSRTAMKLLAQLSQVVVPDEIEARWGDASASSCSRSGKPGEPSDCEDHHGSTGDADSTDELESVHGSASPAECAFRTDEKPESSDLSDSDESAAAELPRPGQPVSLSDLPPRYDPAWVALRNLWKRAWYSRIWVIQEATVARRLVLLCGGQKLRRSAIPPIVTDLLTDMCPDLAQGFYFVRTTQPETRPRQLRLATLMSASISTHATEPRDKVYALMGLVDKTLPEHRLFPIDYAKPVAELYREVTWWCFTQHPGWVLVALELASLDRRIPDLPSWVPDWSIRRATDTLWPIARLQAGGQTDDGGLLPRRGADPDRLVVRAKRLDGVGWTGLVPTMTGDEARDRRALKDALSDWMELVAQLLTGVPEEERLDCLWRTMIGNRYWRGQGPAPGDCRTHFLAWCAQMELQVLPWAGEEPTKAHVSPQEVALFSAAVASACRARKVCVTSNGHVCLAPASSQAGDLIVLLAQGPSAFVLRDKGDHHSLVGACYIHAEGLGLTMEDEGIPGEDFWLQ